MDDATATAYQFGMLLIGTHWRRGEDSIRINCEVREEVLPHLNNAYSEQFSASLRHCMELLRQPLFGTNTMKLIADLGRGFRIQYTLIRRHEALPRGVLGELIDKFEQFVRALAGATPLRLVEHREGEYTSTSSATYTRCNSDDQSHIELWLHVPPGCTKSDFEPSTYELAIKRSRGRNSISFRSDDDSKILPRGEYGGTMTDADIKEEARRLLRDTVFKLPLPD